MICSRVVSPYVVSRSFRRNGSAADVVVEAEAPFPAAKEWIVANKINERHRSLDVDGIIDSKVVCMISTGKKQDILCFSTIRNNDLEVGCGRSNE